MGGIWSQIYLALFLFGSGFLALQFVLGNLGDAFDVDVDGDLDVDVDIDADLDLDIDGDLDSDTGHSDAGPNFSFLTPLILAPMIAGIGIIGLLLSSVFDWSALFHLPISLVGGYAVGYAVYFLLARVFVPMQGSSHLRESDFWGSIGEVTVPIPADRLGEVRFETRGAYLSAPARSVTGESLERGDMIIVEKIEDSVAYVRRTS